MKTIKISRFAIVLVAALMTSTIYSCKKSTPTPASTTPTTSTDIASKVIGNYVGSGETAAGATYVNQTVKVSKVTNTKIKIEPVGHTYITTFEVDIVELAGNIVSNPETEDDDLAIEMTQSPIRLAFDAANGQSFGGFKQ